MIVTVEISLYPLQADYKTVILDFIARVRAHGGIVTYTTEMSTLIKGQWDVVMPLLQRELGQVYTEVQDVSTVIKVVPQDLPIETGYRAF